MSDLSTGKKPRNLYPSASLFYALVIPTLQSIAQSHGYTLALHGSMQTDIDLLACPWEPVASDAATLIEALRAGMGGCFPAGDCPAERPHGRLAWAIYFDEESARNHIGAYLDVSVMPRIVCGAS